MGTADPLGNVLKMRAAVSVVQRLNYGSSNCGPIWMSIMGRRSEEKGTGWSESFAQLRYSLELASGPVTVSQGAFAANVAYRTPDRKPELTSWL